MKGTRKFGLYLCIEDDCNTDKGWIELATANIIQRRVYTNPNDDWQDAYTFFSGKYTELFKRNWGTGYLSIARAK